MRQSSRRGFWGRQGTMDWKRADLNALKAPAEMFKNRIDPKGEDLHGNLVALLD